MGFGAFGSCCSVCPPLPFPFPSVGKEIGVGRSALRNSRPSSQPLSYPRSLYNGMQTARDWNKNRCGYICILKRSFQRLTDGACLVENELQGSHICPMIVTILKAEKAEKKKRLPRTESNLGPSRYQSDVFPITPFLQKQFKFGEACMGAQN